MTAFKWQALDRIVEGKGIVEWSLMEVILDCFFEQYFAELERSSLSSRTKRSELVNYFNAVIEGCCAGKSFYYKFIKFTWPFKIKCLLNLSFYL